MIGAMSVRPTGNILDIWDEILKRSIRARRIMTVEKEMKMEKAKTMMEKSVWRRRNVWKRKLGKWRGRPPKRKWLRIWSITSPSGPGVRIA